MTATPIPRTEHPDPEWWKRSPMVHAADQPLGVDLCDECGHTRDLHGRNSGCRARSASLIGRKLPCLCTNRAISSASGSLYRRAVVVNKANR